MATFHWHRAVNQRRHHVVNADTHEFLCGAYLFGSEPDSPVDPEALGHIADDEDCKRCWRIARRMADRGELT